jgi:pyruvate/2-oxoglutarate dehydrogenase complex dihydrolipoamide dehydrogenase (E3) component
MTNDLKTYDLVVMGGGPAGATAATVASSFGKSVALVDSHQEIGGAGINTGTVPSKTLRETALALSGLKSRNLYGVDLSLRREVTVADFLGHEEHVKDAFHAGITQRLQVGIYTIPEVGMVGETEESLKKKGVAYIVGRANYRENARGRIIGDLDGFLKLLFRQDDLKLIGVHIMGDLATDVVHIGLVAMMCNASANLFVDACLNMPTLGVLYKTATLNALQNIPPSESHA